MKKGLTVLVFTALVLVISAAAVYGDSTDTGWKGYGLYNLNNSEVSISYENDSIVIDGEKVTAVYEYVIKNTSGKNITVNFGYPDNGINKFSVHDGSKYLNYKTRNTDYLRSNYGVKDLQTPEGRWYLFNMVFASDQTRTIKVSIEAEMKKEENDTYGLNFFKDRNYSYAIKSEKTKFNLKLADFKPYHVSELSGIKQEEISADGNILMEYGENYGNGAFIRYQPVDKMVLSKLSESAYKKPKAIVKAFNEKKYEEAMTLCDEYINSPQDTKLEIEQVKFVRAECARLLNRNEEYLDAIGQLDVSRLFPGRIRYKILIDSLEVHDALNNEEEINNILKELIPETERSYPYLRYWLEDNGYRLVEEKEENGNMEAATGPPAVAPAKKGFDILGFVLGFVKTVRESRWTYTVIGIIIGFILGRISKRSRKKKSVYMFRN